MSFKEDNKDEDCELKPSIIKKLEERKKEVMGGKVISTKELLDKLKKRKQFRLGILVYILYGLLSIIIVSSVIILLFT